MLNFLNHLQFGVNELLWLGYLILNFSAVALAYRFWGKGGLLSVVPLSIVLANIQVGKMMTLFGFDGITMGNIAYGGIYLASDILTENELWDIKVSRYMPNSKNTLQILMYWLMGCRSIHPQFQSVSNLGIVNPRLGKTWTIKTSAIPKDIIKQVSTDVIGYKA